MGKTNTRALSLKKPPRFKASCLQSWRFFNIPCLLGAYIESHLQYQNNKLELKNTDKYMKKHLFLSKR